MTEGACTSIYVAIPAYDGKIHVETVQALLVEQTQAIMAGIAMQVAFVPGCSLITMARNQIVAGFLKSEADRLVFIDADVAWEPGAIVQLVQHKADFVGGAYRYKQAQEGYPIQWVDKPELHAVNGLLEVCNLPGGFLALNRAVFERLRAAHPDRGYNHLGLEAFAYFHAPFRDGVLYGEDSCFCAEYRAAGGTVWLDPELTLTHVGGNNQYVGRIGDWLRAR